ncbi:MAG TPA: hypothetical protein VFT87_04125 [Candidatus Saccharimonadales bacterium]|nr:hypothetical protein [Candidatus Saccharimonadales bacterium]
MAHRSVQAGDTLIEVLLAVVILGAVIVASIAIMNRGLTAAQTSVEHSQVRLEINSQFEMLRQARDAYIKDSASANGQTWAALVTAIPPTATLAYGAGCTTNQPGEDFYLMQTATQIERRTYNDTPAALAATPGQGLWIEAKKSDTAVKPFVDFVVRACWVGPGSGDQRTVTAMRLYDPSR